MKFFQMMPIFFIITLVELNVETTSLSRIKRQQSNDDQFSMSTQFNPPSSDFIELKPSQDFQFAKQPTQESLVPAINEIDRPQQIQIPIQPVFITSTAMNSKKKGKDSNESDSDEDLPSIKATTSITNMPSKTIFANRQILASTTQNPIFTITKSGKNTIDSDEDD